MNTKKLKVLFKPFRGYLYRRTNKNQMYPDCAWIDFKNYNTTKNCFTYSFPCFHSTDWIQKTDYMKRIGIAPYTTGAPELGYRVIIIQRLLQFLGRMLFTVLFKKFTKIKITQFIPDYSYNKMK